MPSFGMPSCASVFTWEPEKQIPELTFSPIQNLCTLVGLYELIYYCNSGLVETAHHRTAKGVLEFTINSDKLRGRVVMDESLKNDIDHHCIDAILKPQRYFDDRFELANIDDFPGDIDFNNDPVEVYTQRVVHRQAIRYLSESNIGNVEEHERKYTNSIYFETAEEAQLILDKYPCKMEPLMWLCNHKSIPKEISSIIRGFATAKPLPIFFFEEGDLVLTFNWSSLEDSEVYGRINEFSTHIIARRCTSLS